MATEMDSEKGVLEPGAPQNIANDSFDYSMLFGGRGIYSGNHIGEESDMDSTKNLPFRHNREHSENLVVM